MQVFSARSASSKIMGWCRISSVNFNSVTATFPNMCSKEPLRKQAITHQFVKAIFSFNRSGRATLLVYLAFWLSHPALKEDPPQHVFGVFRLEMWWTSRPALQRWVTCLFWTPQPVLKVCLAIRLQLLCFFLNGNDLSIQTSQTMSTKCNIPRKMQIINIGKEINK